MPLYKIESDGLKLEKIDRKEFLNEAELQSLVDLNIQNMLGIRFIASQYPIPNGRIDSLGLDEDGIPVIIEYKWKKDLSAIVQGLFYLDWIMQNKRPFESIVKDKLGKEVEVSWSTQPRLLIIAQDFDVKELSAINQMGPRIELYKYSLYDGLFNIEGVNIVETKTFPDKRIGDEKKEEHTVEKLTARANEKVQAVFYQLRERILGLSDSVWERVMADYVDYRTISTFTTIFVQKSQLRIAIKMGEKKLEEQRGISKPIPKTYGWGLMSNQFYISDLEEIDYAMILITQAYDYVGG